MRSTSLALLSIFLITFVLAIPAPDKYVHFQAPPRCPNNCAVSCLRVPYCKIHRDKGDLFSANSLNPRDAPKSENLDVNLTDALTPSLPSSFTTRGLNVLSKRMVVIQCGVLSCPLNQEVSLRFTNLVAGIVYDLITDYPYNGATGGKETFPFPAYFALNLFNLRPQTSRIMLLVIPTLTNIPHPPTGIIGIYSRVIVNGAARVIRVAHAHTGYGGLRFSFRAPQNSAWSRVIFVGDNLAAAVTYYIGRHEEAG